MKKVILAISLASFTLFAACKKANTGDIASSGQTNISTTIQGDWELRQTSAAMNPVATHYTPGNGNILKFTDSSYEVFEPGHPLRSGTYQVSADSTVEQNVCLVLPKGEYEYSLVYDNNTNVTKKFIKIVDNKLTIISGCYAYDAGHMEVYERLSNGH